MKTSRRTLLKNSAAAAAALSLDWRYAQAQAETVRIGVIFDHSGPFAAGGSVACAIGAQIAIDLCNERGGAIELLEGERDPARRFVIVEFPSMQRTHEWYGSPEYAEALKVRAGALTRTLTFVEGVD